VVTVTRRALITGGAGFLGSHLCDRLLLDGWSVLCVDNFVTGSRANIAHLEDHPRFSLMTADVSSPFVVSERLDAVLHLASPASPPDYLRLPIETMKVGSLGTLHALELARRDRARFFLASTSETYGDPQVHPQPETYWGNVNPVGPRAVYDEAKRFAEALTMAYRREHKVDTTIVRIFNTYGPRMRPDDGRAIPNFISQALRSEPITVAGDGRQTRSVCYVDDLIDGIVRLLASSHAGPVNIGNPNELSMLELAESVRELSLSDSPIAFVPRPQDDPMIRKPDIALAGAVLGWAPRVELREGLTITIEWFRRNQQGQGPRAVPAQPTEAWRSQHSAGGFRSKLGSAREPKMSSPRPGEG
jgi:dTDP-glucose 4,6-dehydratase